MRILLKNSTLPCFSKTYQPKVSPLPRPLDRPLPEPRTTQKAPRYLDLASLKLVDLSKYAQEQKVMHFLMRIQGLIKNIPSQ